MLLFKVLRLEHLELVLFFHCFDVAFQKLVTRGLLGELVVSFVELFLEVCYLLGDLLGV